MVLNGKAIGFSNFYKENDIVKYRGIIYRCIIVLTSASNITLGLESNSANWSVWAKGPIT